MSNCEETCSYVNHFDGYTTTFYVPPSPDQKRECVIRFDDITPTEIIIPYDTDLTPDLFRETIGGVVSKCKQFIKKKNPYRYDNTLFKFYKNGKQYISDSDHYNLIVYVNSNGARINIRTFSCDIESSFNEGRKWLFMNLPKIKKNMNTLLTTMKY